MSRGNLLLLAARFAFSAFALVTSFYCLLAYIPFTYRQLIEVHLIGWFTTFERLHPYLYAALLLPVVVTLREERRHPRTAVLSGAFILSQGLVALLLMAYSPLARLRNDRISFIASLAALVPLLWLAAIDLLGRHDRVRWQEPPSGQERPAFLAAVQSALYVACLYFALSSLRAWGVAEPALRGSEISAAFVWSLVSHLLLFLGAFVALNLVSVVSGLSRTPGRIEFFLCTGLAALLVAAAVRRLILSPLSFTGTEADIFSALTGAAVGGALAGAALRIHSDAQAPAPSGLGVLLAPLTIRAAVRWGRSAWVAGLAALAVFLSLGAAPLDWNYLFQKLSACAVWALAFAFFYTGRADARRRPDRALLLLGAAVLALGGHRVLEASRTRLPAIFRDPALQVGLALDRYAGYDVSFLMLHEALEPVGDRGSFYRYLQRNTNVSRAVKIEPVSVDLVKELAPSAGEKPHIFVFVIDSLRRDYVSPYNEAVSFTPSIGRFAAEGVVMQNAFTRYAATGLSEPAIWAGGMLIHKQYVTPFHPMNSLEKLLEIDGYESFVSVDTILRTILKPSASLVELDRGVLNRDYDFCRSLEDLQSRLAGRPDPTRPAFAFTQPQNVHIAQIRREGASVPPGESYPGFYGPYASRIRRMDECFGRFISFLRERGLYERSLVILTSDHGDSLGEEGRWGHAYTVYPEVLRIPLIVRLPEALGSGLVFDARAPAFTIDITPTLYYLLGHRPIVPSELFGRPLFTATWDEQRAYRRDSYLVVSSYGPMYGILDDGGRSLFIADAVNFQDSFWDLTAGPNGARGLLSVPMKKKYEKLIRERVGEIARFYGFDGGS